RQGERAAERRAGGEHDLVAWKRRIEGRLQVVSGLHLQRAPGTRRIASFHARAWRLRRALHQRRGQEHEERGGHDAASTGAGRSLAGLPRKRASAARADGTQRNLSACKPRPTTLSLKMYSQ